MRHLERHAYEFVQAQARHSNVMFVFGCNSISRTRSVKSYLIEKGENFALERKKKAADLTMDMILKLTKFFWLWFLILFEMQESMERSRIQGVQFPGSGCCARFRSSPPSVESSRRISKNLFGNGVCLHFF